MGDLFFFFFLPYSLLRKSICVCPSNLTVVNGAIQGREKIHFS